MCIHIHIYVHEYIYICIYVCIYMYIYIYVCVCMYVNECICISICLQSRWRYVCRAGNITMATAQIYAVAPQLLVFTERQKTRRENARDSSRCCGRCISPCSLKAVRQDQGISGAFGLVTGSQAFLAKQPSFARTVLFAQPWYSAAKTTQLPFIQYALKSTK